MSKAVNQFLLMAAMMGGMGMGSHGGGSYVDTSKVNPNIVPPVPDKAKYPFKFSAGGKTFECMAASRKDAITMFNSWKRLNKIR